MRILLLLLPLLLALPARAQEELGDMSGPSRSWSMISIHRVWVPQANDRPNGGFGINGFFGIDADRRTWVGFSVLGTGVVERDALLINAGLGWWFLGDASLGAYTYAMTGLSTTSANALTGFNFFSDPTTTYGLGSQLGVGGAVEVFTNIKLHLNAYGLWLTNDGGVTPYGLQFGLTFGGR